MNDIFERVLEHDALAELDPPARRLELRDLVGPGEVDERARTVRELADVIDGFGPLSPLMELAGVTDVLVNGPNEVWIDGQRGLELTTVTFDNTGAVLALIDRLLAAAGARADVSRPVADARLKDGSRLSVVLPPISETPVMSIRRLPRRRAGLDELVEWGMLSPAQAADLAARIGASETLIISGATGAGKTTLLNALVSQVGDAERVVILEEIPELEPACTHSIRLRTRPANIEGRGEVDLSQLVRTSLRMRPDRIVIGEVRGAEAWPALAALSTGHRGSILTVHARSATDALDRLVALALEASVSASEEFIRARTIAAVDAVVHLARDARGRRCLTEIHDVR